MDRLELWGGLECTVNRVGAMFRDQTRETGHHDRAPDLDRIAELGITAIRYPILWERVAPDAPDIRDWAWTDERTAQLRQRELRPIAGLIHHGSGPRYTSLLADDFATGLARHALAAAERYPWIDDWTPVNEPLTTARFSALYGHWYPHRRDERSFWLALLNQVDAVRLSMRAIRSVRPGARLIQTEDLGRTYATDPVRDQAAFDNVRRWMSWDLLCGMVVPGHDFWGRLCAMGFEGRLERIAADPCPPDLIGINHYLTSDRFLDHRLDRYARALAGSNDDRAYIDTEAVRILHPAPAGLDGVIREAWQRYAIPIAITEVHNGCTREEQLRWTLHAWRTAQKLREAGIDVRAVTSWALFGSTGWNTLLTAPGRYEAGAYDVSGGRVPRKTALAPLLQALAHGRQPDHPAVAGPGWWHRDVRLHHRAEPRPAPIREHVQPGRTAPARSTAPILITGGSGTLGRALAAACDHRGLAYTLTTREQLDLDSETSIYAALDRHRPWALVNAAGWVRVDAAETEAAACFAANTDGALRIARACAARGIHTVSISSDLIFDGASEHAYVESDIAHPLNVYGRSKLAAERAIGDVAGANLIVRTAAFFSPFDPHNFAFQLVRALRSGGDRVRAADDQVITPTYVPDLCDALLDLLIDRETGVWHLTNGTQLSWSAFGRRLAAASGHAPGRIDAVPGADLGWTAPRPPRSPLASERGTLLPPLDDAIARFVRDLQV